MLSNSVAVAVVPAGSAPTQDDVEALLAYEADCWHVHDAMSRPDSAFALLDVRSPEMYAAGHVPGAINLPHGRIVERNLVEHPPETLFVVYCAGAAGPPRRPVKKMSGWKDEGFDLMTHG